MPLFAYPCDTEKLMLSRYVYVRFACYVVVKLRPQLTPGQGLARFAERRPLLVPNCCLEPPTDCARLIKTAR